MKGNSKKAAAEQSFSMQDFVRRLAFFGALILFPLYALVIFNIYDHYRLAMDEATDSGLRIARAAAYQERTAVATTEPFLTVLAKLPEVRANDVASCNAFFASLLPDNPLYVNIGAVTADGNVFCSGLPIVGEVNVADRVWFKRAIETEGFAAGEFTVGAIAKKRTINFGYPYRDEAGKIAGVVYAALDVELFKDLAQDLRLPPESTFSIFDREGYVLARFPDPEQWVGKNVKDEPVYRALFGGPLQEGIYEAEGLDGVDRIHAFTPLDPRAASSPLVTVGFSKKVLFNDIKWSVALNAAALALITVIILSLAFVGGRELVVRRVAALQEVDRIKSEFVSLASHQLRTPLTAIRWLNELLASDAIGPLNETQKRMVDEMGDSVGKLLALVNELLDLSRIDAGKLKIVLRDVDLAAVTKEAMLDLGKSASAKKVKMELSAEDGLPRVRADEALARQVVMNLLSNAVKYSKEGGAVRVKIGRGVDEVLVSVVDEGVGVPVKEQARIFERFFRASNVRVAQADGTGLGLAVSRSVAEAMGGRMGFSSEEGRGSVFWFTLPVNHR